MQPRNIEHLFQNFTYQKPAAEIIVKANEKIISVKAKIEDRAKRVAALRAEYGIDDAALVQLLTAARKNSQAHVYSYTTSATGGGEGRMEEKAIGAGVVNNLLTENDFIESEKDQVTRLEMIARNLKPIPRYAEGNGAVIPPEDFSLTYEELKFLGF